MAARGVLTAVALSLLMKQWPFTLLSLCLGLFTIASLRSYLRLRHIPGPLIASLTDWWWVQKSISGKGHLAISDLCDRYGTDAHPGSMP